MQTDTDPTPPHGTPRNGITVRNRIVRTWHRMTVCADCIHVAANGTADATPEHVAAFTAATRRHRTELVPTCPTAGCCDPDGDPYWFSWSPCEWCGETLGGDRMHAAIETR